MPMQSKLKAYLLLNGYNVGLYRSDLREIKKCGLCMKIESASLFLIALECSNNPSQNQYTIFNLNTAHHRLKR